MENDEILLSKYKLKDFKAFKGSHEINLKKFNVIIGENGSGKSSIIDGLKLISSGVFNNSEHLYRIHARNKMANCQIEVEFKGWLPFSIDEDFKDTELFINNPKLRYIYSNSGGSVEVNFGDHKYVIDGQTLSHPKITYLPSVNMISPEFRSWVPIQFNSTLSRKLMESHYSNMELSNYYTNANNDDQINQLFMYQIGPRWEISNPNQKYLDLIVNFKTKGLRRKFGIIIDDILPEMLFISPSRNIDKRISQLERQIPRTSKDRSRTNGILTFLQYAPRPDMEKKLNQISLWAEKFNMPKLQSILEENASTRTQFHDPLYKIPIDLFDGGFGTSQLIYIIVECIMAEKNSILIIDEPEIHLHAKFQAKIIDLLIETMNRGIQIIVATHSEYFLLRLQRRIAENQISHEDISILECVRNEEKITIKNFQLDEKGRYKDDHPSVLDFAAEEFREWNNKLME